MKLINPSERPAICFRDETISYARMLQFITSFAECFTAEPEERIVIFSENRP